MLVIGACSATLQEVQKRYTIYNDVFVRQMHREKSLRPIVQIDPRSQLCVWTSWSGECVLICKRARSVTKGRRSGTATLVDCCSVYVYVSVMRPFRKSPLVESPFCAVCHTCRMERTEHHNDEGTKI